MQTKIYSVDSIQFELLKSNPPHLLIIAHGRVISTGWTDGKLIPLFSENKLPQNGIYEFDFVATKPTGRVGFIIAPISASYLFQEIPKDIKGIIIHSANNSLDKSYPSEVITSDLMQLTANPIVQSIHDATGFSNSLSFDEAFIDAINNLPPDQHHFPDKFTFIKVMEIGCQFGSIAGLHRMYVKVQATY